MADLVRQLLAKRESWLDLGSGKRVLVRRPAEMQMVRFRSGFTTEHATDCVVGWEGFTALDAGGDSDAVLPYDSALWAAMVEDNVAWFDAVASRVIELVEQHLAAKGAASGN